MPFVCHRCGTLWANPDKKPCSCFPMDAFRVWVEEDVEYLCGNCGKPWPIGQKPCNCWPNGVRIRKSEVGDQTKFPLPGL